MMTIGKQKPSRYKIHRNKLIMFLRKKGYAYEEIAKVMGVVPRCIQMIIKREANEGK